MNRPPGAIDETLVTWILRVGSSASQALLAAGLLVWILVPSSELGRPLLHAGLVTLMATPVARLLVALADEVRAREWVFAALGLLVLALLAGSLLVGFAG